MWAAILFLRLATAGTVGCLWGVVSRTGTSTRAGGTCQRNRWCASIRLTQECHGVFVSRVGTYLACRSTRCVGVKNRLPAYQGGPPLLRTGSAGEWARGGGPHDMQLRTVDRGAPVACPRCIQASTVV